MRKKTSDERVFQVRPNIDFDLDKLTLVRYGFPEGFYVEEYEFIKLKSGLICKIFKRDLCGIVKYFATTDKKVTMRAIGKLLAYTKIDSHRF